MQSKSQRPRELDGVLSTLNVAIETLNLAKEISSITPAKAAFGSVIVLLTMIRVFLSPCWSPTVNFRLNDSPGVDDQRTGLRRPRVILRQSMQGS